MVTSTPMGGCGRTSFPASPGPHKGRAVNTRPPGVTAPHPPSPIPCRYNTGMESGLAKQAWEIWS